MFRDVLSDYQQASQYGTQTNEDLGPLGDAQDAVATARQAYERRAALERQPGPASTEAERAARERVQATLRDQRGGDAGLDSLVREASAHHYSLLDVVGPFPENPTFEAPPPAAPVPDVGMWWWAETNWWTPGNLLGLASYWEDGVRITGQLNWDDGDLWFGNTGVVARFAIGSDRLPPPGWYRSWPPTSLWGEVWGFTGVSGPFSFGDNWSKCWLHATQTVRGPSGAVIASGHWWDTLLHFESDGSHGVRGLPGSLMFPAVNFFVSAGVPLTVELELKFDIQLEGSSAFRFGNYGGWVPSLFRTPQWNLSPV